MAQCCWPTDLGDGPAMCPRPGSLALFSVSSGHNVTYLLSSLAERSWGLDRNAGMSITCEGEGWEAGGLEAADREAKRGGL